MAETTTKTNTHTKAIAAVGVIAALGLMGWAAAIGIPKMFFKPDLVVASVIDSPDPASDGAAVTHMITVTNTGRSTATNAQMVIDLPAELTYTSYTTGSTTLRCTAVGQRVTCTDTLAAGSSVTVAITSQLASLCGGIMILVDVDVDPLNRIKESSETNNTDSEALTITSGDCPDLGVEIDTRSYDSDTRTYTTTSTIPFDDQIEYTITLTNNGTADSGEFIHTLDYPTWEGGGGFSQDPATTICEHVTEDTSSAMTCTIQSIAPGDSVTWTMSRRNNTDTSVLCNDVQDMEVIATVDPDNLIAESDESNNETTTTTTLVGSSC